MGLITLYLTSGVYIFQDPSQLTLLDCFSELVSDEELADITSFDEDNKPIASSSHTCSSSSSEDHKDDFDNFNARRKTQTTKNLASAQTMDDDPDFSVPHQASSKSLHIDTLKSVQQSKGTVATTGSQTSRSLKIVSTKSGGGNRDKTSSQKQTVKHKTSTAASRLANYLLQQDIITPAEESGHRGDQVAQSTCIDRDTYTGAEPCKPTDNVDSLEWFGFDHEEDLDSFEHFDDEADFCDNT